MYNLVKAETYYLVPGTNSGGTLQTTVGSRTPTSGDMVYLTAVAGTVPATGTVTIDGGSYNVATTSLGREWTSNDNFDNYTVIWQNGATWTNNNVIHFGRKGTVTAQIIGGSSIINNSNHIYLAYQGNTGEANVTVGGNGAGTITSKGIIMGGMKNGGNRYSGKSATLNILTDGTVSTTETVWVGFGAGEGKILVDGGKLTAGNRLNIGYCDSDMSSTATNPYRSTGTVELKSGSITVTGGVNNQVFIGTPSTRTVEGNGTGKLHISGGTLSALGGIYVYESGTLEVSGGTMSGTIYLRAGGTIQWGVGNVHYVDGSQLTSAENAGTVEITNNAGKLTFSSGSHVNIAKLNGEAYLDGSSSNRSHGYLTSVYDVSTQTGVIYGGYIDGNSWPSLHANVGTAAAPVTIDWDVAGTATHESRGKLWQYNNFYIGEKGKTGYVTIANGYLNGSNVYLGDDEGSSSGTLELKSGVGLKKHGFNNPNDIRNYSVYVGVGKGTGVLYLNGGGLGTKGTVTIGANGTLKLGQDFASAIPAGTSVSVSEGGVVEVAAGTWGASLTRITNNGTLHLNGGTIADNYTVRIGGANANCPIFQYSRGTLSNRPVLSSDGLLIMDAAGTYRELNLSPDSSGGRVQLRTALSGLQVNGDTRSVNIVLEANRGNLSFGGSNRGHISFVKTRGDGVEYGGRIDGYAWPTASVNVGTADDPVVLETYAVGYRTEDDSRIRKFSIGENGTTGYLEFTGGTLRTAPYEASGKNGGIILGDENPASNGTLALVGGEILGHQNTGDGGTAGSYGYHNDIMVGSLGGTGRLILAGGKMDDSRVHVRLGANGTLEIANGVYNWTDLRLTSYDGAPGNVEGTLEITGGSLDLQGRSTTLAKLNSKSQYNLASAKGTLTNSSTTSSAVTLNNTAAGAYNNYRIEGNIDVMFGQEGLADPICSTDGAIQANSLTIVTDTFLENAAVDVSRLEILSGSRLGIAWNEFTAESLIVDGILQTSFHLEESLTQSFDHASIHGTIDIEWEGEWDGGLFYTIFTSTDTIDWLDGMVNAPTGFRALMLDNALVLGHESAVPEPSTWLLLALSGLLLGWKRMRFCRCL